MQEEEFLILKPQGNKIDVSADQNQNFSLTVDEFPSRAAAENGSIKCSHHSTETQVPRERKLTQDLTDNVPFSSIH